MGSRPPQRDLSGLDRWKRVSDQSPERGPRSRHRTTGHRPRPSTKNLGTSRVQRKYRNRNEVSQWSRGRPSVSTNTGVYPPGRVRGRWNSLDTPKDDPFRHTVMGTGVCDLLQGNVRSPASENLVSHPLSMSVTLPGTYDTFQSRLGLTHGRLLVQTSGVRRETPAIDCKPRVEEVWSRRRTSKLSEGLRS